MMNNIKKQQGNTFIGWIITIAIVISLLLTGSILGPVLLKQHNLRTVMNDLAADKTILQLGKRELYAKFAKHLDINSLDDVVNPNDLKIERVKGSNDQRKLALQYETRKHWVGNIDFIIKFDYSVEIK